MDSTVRVLFLGDASSAVRSVSRLQSGFGSLGRAAGIAGAAIGVGIVGGLAAATRAAVDFDREMRNVNSIAKLNERQFQALSKEVLALSKETAQAPKTLAKGLYDLVSSGFDAKESITVLRASAKAATAGLTDTATATKAVAAALNAYHRPATDARKVSDVLFQTVNKGVLTFEQLAQNMGDLVPAAAPLGISLEEVGASMATLTLQGVPAAEAATRVKNTMLQLASPSKALSKLLADNGFASAEAAIKAETFSGVLEMLDEATKGSVTRTAALTPEIRSLMGVVGLTGKNLAVYRDNLVAMRNATDGAGATNKAFAEQAKSISFQWQRAKASLTAAAIPVGQLLFPLLEKGASKVEDFARSVETNMPTIRREFGDLSRIAGDASRTILDFARSAEGMSVIAGGAAAVGFSKVAIGIGGIVSGLLAIHPLLGLAAGAVGILAGGMLYLYLQSHQVSEEFKNALRAINDLASALDAKKQAAINFAAAITSQKAAQLSVRDAIRERNRVEAEAGRGSDRYKQAVVNVERAYQALAQANLDVARTTKAKRDAEDKAGATAADYRKKMNDLAQSHRHVAKNAQDVEKTGINISRFFGEGKSNADAMSDALKFVNRELAKKDAVGYARDMRLLAEQMEKAGVKGYEFARAAAALAEALGRIPSRKEVTLIVRMQGATDLGALEAPRRGRNVRPRRALGGFIPGATGEAVPIMAHAGEVVLNPAQQEVLGGPRFLARLFGFTGDEGPAFATGGIVRRPRRTRSVPPRKAQRRARKAVAGVERIDQAESDLDRAYGQLVRQYGQSQEVFIRTDAEGNEYISQPDIDQRVLEIDDLISERGRMLDLLEDEKKALRQAIKRLREAIAALVRAIRDERKTIDRLRRRISAERKKKKPNTNLIGRLEGQVSAHESSISSRQSSISEFQGAITDAQSNLEHAVPFDVRDVQLDISELQGERRDVVGTTLPVTTGGGAAEGPNVEELLRQLGQLRLALGIQTAQLGIIGSFQRGTLHVPETGLALVHAGESIAPAGAARGGDGASIGDLHVTLVLEGDAAGLERFIKVKAVEAAPEINVKINQEFDTRRRSGVL